MQSDHRNAPPVPSHIAVKIAGPAGVDPRTVKKYLRGGELRPLTQERVEAGLRAIGRQDLIRVDDEGARAGGTR